MLVQTRDDWQIYGGNIASTLAGEFSFTLALALGLFALGALGKTLDTGRRPWLPALLIAAVGDVARRRRDGARAVRGVLLFAHPPAVAHVAARAPDRRRRGRAHRGLVAAAASRGTT